MKWYASMRSTEQPSAWKSKCIVYGARSRIRQFSGDVGELAVCDVQCQCHGAKLFLEPLVLNDALFILLDQ